MANNDKQIAACKKLGMSDEEIQALLAADKEVDRGTVMDWDLSPEEHKKAMKYANVTEKTTKKSEETPKKGKTAYNFDTSERKRKENPTKAGIIAEIAQFLMENSHFAPENVEITNKERQIAFQIGDNSYEFTLVQKRKPK